MTTLPAIHTLTPAHVGLPIRIQDAGLDITGILVRLEADSYFREHSAAFLRQHPTCTIRIINEYDEDVTDHEEGQP